MARVLAVLAWLCAGHAVLGGLYWLLLNIPESNAWMLAASLAAVIAAAWVAGLVEMTAMLALGGDGPPTSAARRAAGRAWLIAFPLVVFAAIWWVTGWAADWHTRYAGQIDAWLIAKTGWTRTAWLHSGLTWFLAFVRYGAGTSLALALLAALAAAGPGGMASRWPARGLAWRRLIVISLALLAGLWLPWQAVYWRPAVLPSTWVQPAFAAARLLVLYVIGNLAWAVALRTAARQS